MALQERPALADGTVELPEPWRSAAVTVVLPTYNEAANLPVIAAELLALPLPGLSILVADDNSPDGTGTIADQLAERYGPDRMTVVHRPEKQGLGRAYVDGMTRAIAAGAEFVVQMDSDLSHAPKYLPQMLGTLLSTDADVVIGSRYVTGASLASEWSWHRRALSGFANAYVRALLRLGIRDVTAGFKIWRSSAAANHRRGQHPQQRLQLPGRDELPVGAERPENCRAAHSLRRTPGRRQQDEHVGAARVGADAVRAAPPRPLNRT